MGAREREATVGVDDTAGSPGASAGGDSEWLETLLARVPKLPADGDNPLRWGEILPSVCYNRPHVFSLIGQELPDVKADVISRAKIGAFIDDEWARAVWQASPMCRWLGVEVTLVAVMLIAIGVIGDVKWQAWALSNPVVILALAGAIGGSAMALFGYVHAFLHRDIQPTFWWWNVTKPIFGAITGLVSAGLVEMGLTSAGAHGQGKSLILLAVVAFTAGFKEQWFLSWLSQLKPRSQAPGTPAAPISPAPPHVGSSGRSA